MPNLCTSNFRTQDLFPSSYAVARDLLASSLKQLGWSQESLAIDAKGPSGESLAIDVGCSASQPGDATLVLSSGLHGVEGFFGSAVQLAQLAQWCVTRPPKGIRIVLLHALNPFGYAWVRRCDELNRDLNRNFLLEGEPYSGCPALYPQLDSFLNPPRAPASWQLFAIPALVQLARHGFGKLQSTIAGGQYEFPKGLFYGGNHPGQINHLLTENLPRWLDASQRVVHFDFHTGLGKRGSYRLLLDSPLRESHRLDFNNWLGPQEGKNSSPADSTGFYRATGSLGRWCCAHSHIPDYLYACAEFGTYGPLHMLRTLRAENQSHHWGRSDSTATIRSKQKLKEAFCPASPRWRRQVLAQASRLINSTIHGLSRIP